jgi:ArsR family metal-binding transcriptional regulator
LEDECVCERRLDFLIPFMARFIRGGAFHPDGPVLAFEEEHKLISFWSDRIVICRADDLLDAWILVRTAIELVMQAWRRKDTILPEEKARLGIGAIEIFRRLPATNCGLCGHKGCMEFSMLLLTGRSRLEECKPAHEKSDHRKSLEWLMRAIGLISTDATPE